MLVNTVPSLIFFDKDSSIINVLIVEEIVQNKRRELLSDKSYESVWFLKLTMRLEKNKM